jgi:hypothetical protein
LIAPLGYNTLKELIMDVTQLRSLLRQNVVTVTFTKVNGDIRVMDCTTKWELIPPSGWPQGKIELSEETSNKTIRVYDVKAQGWRSFIIDNVTQVDLPSNI